MKTQVQNCCICSQIVGDQENDLISTLLQEEFYIRRVAFENDYFAVIPSLGPLTPGHSLICPKQHIKSIAQQNPETDLSFLEIKEKTIKCLENIYKKEVHCFEHGNGRNSSRLICTVEHSHLHLVPADLNHQDILFSEIHWIKIGDSLSELRSIVGDYEYLYYESPDKMKFVAIGKNREFESQYLRKVFANALHNGNLWNWRDAPDPFSTDKIYKSFIKEFSTH